MTETATAPSFASETDTPLTILFPDLNGEIATTRKILERVPDGKDDWRPHEKSMTLGGLATHLAQLPGYGVAIITTDDFDGATLPRDRKVANNAERLKMFDDLAAQLRAMLAEMTWEQARAKWTFRFGDRVLVQGPRSNLMRSMVLTHSTHHRAQLGVFLRLLGIPIPGSYGPSADEPFK